MNSFLPHTSTIFTYSILTIVAVLCIGYLITIIKRYLPAIITAWLLVVTSIFFIERLTSNEGAGFRMLSIIMVTLFSMKVVVTVESYKGSILRLSFIKWIAFSAGWFGMRPKIFETMGNQSLPGSSALILFGLSRLLSGTIILVAVKFIGFAHQSIVVKFILTGFILTGLSLIIHFGILNISAGMWRLSGVNTSTLFRSPLSSTSLTEFWGKRWNLAFSEMTSIAIFRPFKNTMGVTLATILAFLFSGLLHELAISLPVKAGLGLPLLYFFIHGLAMLLEQALEKKGWSISKYKIIGRTWVIFWLVVPMPILFHEEFIKKVVLPLIY